MGEGVQEVERRQREEEDRAGTGKPEFTVKEIQGGRSQGLFGFVGQSSFKSLILLQFFVPIVIY